MPPAPPPSESNSSSRDYPALTNEDVALLYQIVTLADQHPIIETKPFRAITAAYDDVLAQHGIHRNHDQIYFRFMFKLGSRKVAGHSLYECFETQLEECGIRIEFDSNPDQTQEVTVEAHRRDSRDKKTEIYDPTAAWANTDTPGRSRRASFESFYDAIEDSIRPVDPWVRSHAPNGLSRMNTMETPEQRPETRATTRPTEKIHTQRAHNRPTTAHTNAQRFQAGELTNGSNGIYPTSATTMQIQPVVERSSAALQSRQRRPSSPAVASRQNRVSNGNHGYPPDGHESPPPVTVDALFYRPTDTQLVRDVDTFQQYSSRRVARASLQKWCGLAFRAKNKHESMVQRANDHDLRILLRQGFQQWQTNFHQRKKGIETRRFFENLERRASKARDLYLLTKAFTHWAQSSSDHVQRTSAVRRHLLGSKCFNAWYEVTILNEMKVHQYQLSKYMQIWKQVFARMTASESKAVILYSDCLVKNAYWRWFWTFCESRAPAWRAGRLKKSLFVQWTSKQQILGRKHQLVSDLRRETIARWSFMKWLQSMRTTRTRMQQALSFSYRNSLSHALTFWELHRHYEPRARQISNMVDWRVAGTTFATIITRYRAGRQAEVVRKSRIKRNAWTNWNDALRKQYMIKKINDRILTEQLYRWALAQRCDLIHRNFKRGLKSRIMSRISIALCKRKKLREDVYQRLRTIVGDNLLRQVLAHWNVKMTTTRQRNQLAYQFRAPRITEEIVQAWSRKTGQLQKLDEEAKRAAEYFPVNKYFKYWLSAAIESKRLKRRNGYIQVRKTIKMKLAAKVLHLWQDSTNERRQSYQRACSVDHGRLLSFGAGLYDQWQARANVVIRHDEHASQHHAVMVARQCLQDWCDRLRTQWRMEDLARLNDEMHLSNVALAWLHQLHLRAIEVRGRDANAQSLRNFYEKRHCQGVLRRWRELAAKKRNQSPGSTGLRGIPFDIQAPSVNTPLRRDKSLDLDQGLDPGNRMSTVRANTYTTPVSELLSTPSKRARTARELVGMSTTPAGTPLGFRLKTLMATGPSSTRRRELGRSTNFQGSTFGTILEASPRTPRGG